VDIRFLFLGGTTDSFVLAFADLLLGGTTDSFVLAFADLLLGGTTDSFVLAFADLLLGGTTGCSIMNILDGPISWPFNSFANSLELRFSVLNLYTAPDSLP